METARFQQLDAILKKNSCFCYYREDLVYCPDTPSVLWRSACVPPTNESAYEPHFPTNG